VASEGDLEEVLDRGGQGKEGQQGGVGLGEAADEDDVVVGLPGMPDDAVPALSVRAALTRGVFADDAEPVGVVNVDQGVTFPGEGRECREIGDVAGHAVDPVHADHLGDGRWGVIEEPGQCLDVVGGVATHYGSVGSGDRAPVVDGLVGLSVQEDPSLVGQGRDHGHVDVGDRRQDEGVGGAEQGGEAFFDVEVQARVAEQAGPTRMRAPPA